MCGIAGIVKYKDNPIKNIETMNQKIHRRGPDAGDYWLCENDRIVLGHRRLAIVDLTECGSQPMVSASERYVMVYNGEIYNALEIKGQMAAAFGVESYRGTSDTEILLRAIEHYGLKETLVKCRGMFALAVYDRQEKVLKLARDRMGEKPLYYGLVNGSFVFSSDINAIKVVDGFQNPIEEKVLRAYFVNGYISRKLGIAPTIEDATRPKIMPWPKAGLKVEDLMRMCGSGIYVTAFNGGNSNSATGDFSYGVEGFLFEDGQIVRPISEMLMTGNFITLWGDLIAAGDDARTCLSKLIPTLAFSNVDFSG